MTHGRGSPRGCSGWFSGLGAFGGNVMTIKEKLLILWVFVVVLVGFVMSHVTAHVTSALEHFLAMALPLLCGWN